MPRQQSKLRPILTIAGVLINLACLVYLYLATDVARVWQLAKATGPQYFLILALFLGVGMGLRAWRWRLLLQPAMPTAFSRLLSAILIGFAGNYLLPLRLGELVRAYAVKRLQGVPFVTSLASQAVERITDTLMLLLLLGLTLLALGSRAAQVDPNQWLAAAGGTLLVICLGVLLALYLLLVFPQRVRSLLARIAGALLPALAGPMERFLDSFIQGLKALGSLARLSMVLLASGLVWAALLLMYLCFLPAMGLESDILMAALGLVGGTLGTLIPAASGSLGTVQVGMVWGMTAAGADYERAVAFSLVFWAANAFFIVTAGLVELWRHGLSLSRLSRAAAQARAQEQGEGLSPAAPDGKSLARGDKTGLD